MLIQRGTLGEVMEEKFPKDKIYNFPRGRFLHKEITHGRRKGK